jgi:hypothetical protein
MNSPTLPSCRPFAASAEYEQLTARLRSRLNGRVRDIHVLSRENGVVLKGQSRTYYAKQLAQHVVMEATELPIIANEIEVF